MEKARKSAGCRINGPVLKSRRYLESPSNEAGVKTKNFEMLAAYLSSGFKRLTNKGDFGVLAFRIAPRPWPVAFLLIFSSLLLSRGDRRPSQRF